jgi:hypothetical protein
MEVKGLILALLVTGSVIGIVGFYTNLGTIYGVTPSDNLTSIQKFNATERTLNATYRAVTNTSTLFTNTSLGAYIDPIAGATMGIINIFLLFTQIPSLYGSLIADMAVSFGAAGLPIPTWFLGIVVSAILLIIVFAVINFIRSGTKVE